jgi:hypothetical protein
VLAATGLVGAIALTACGGGTTTGNAIGTTAGATGALGATGSASTTVAPAPSAPASVATPPSAAATAPPAAQPAQQPAEAPTKDPAAVTAHTSRTPECKSSGLKLSLVGDGAATSHDFWTLKFTNAGSRSCVIVGFPGVSYVAGDKGVQVGQPAVREGHIGQQITLAPGHFASTVIDAVAVDVFPSATCHKTSVRGFRVYPPDETASMYIPLPHGGEGCTSTPPSPQLTVVTIQPGLAQPTGN